MKASTSSQATVLASMGMLAVVFSFSANAAEIQLIRSEDGTFYRLSTQPQESDPEIQALKGLAFSSTATDLNGQVDSSKSLLGAVTPADSRVSDLDYIPVAPEVTPDVPQASPKTRLVWDHDSRLKLFRDYEVAPAGSSSDSVN